VWLIVATRVSSSNRSHRFVFGSAAGNECFKIVIFIQTQSITAAALVGVIYYSAVLPSLFPCVVPQTNDWLCSWASNRAGGPACWRWCPTSRPRRGRKCPTSENPLHFRKLAGATKINITILRGALSEKRACVSTTFVDALPRCIEYQIFKLWIGVNDHVWCDYSLIRLDLPALVQKDLMF
jgi:hypothetical protein